MIHIEELVFGKNPIITIEGGMKLVSKQGVGGRASDLTILSGKEEIFERAFAGGRFNNNLGSLFPLVEICRWEGLIFVMGVARWLIFSAEDNSRIGSLDLFRSDSDDSGFYNLNVIEYKDLFVAIYEGGVAAISKEGEIKFHYKKKWDDELLKFDDNKLIFLAENGIKLYLNMDPEN